MSDLSKGQDSHPHEGVTYFWDRFRSLSGGIIEPVYGIFVLLIAIRIFDASSTQKSILAAGVWIGMFLMPLFLWIVSSLRMRSNNACSLYTFITGVLFIVSIFAQSANQFVIALTMTMLIGVQGFTLLPKILVENYHPLRRGKWVGTTSMIQGFAFLVVSQLFGVLMDQNLDNYIWILAIAGTAYFSASYSYYRIPSEILTKPTSRFPYHTLSLFWKNPRFSKLAIFWLLIEFGNLMAWPMRIEYAGNERYGMKLSNTEVSLLVAIIPLTVSLVTNRIWGRMFDLMRVESIQSVMGVLIVLGILPYFLTSNYFLMLGGMAIFGMAFGAQKVLNSLWLTKVVGKDEVADYISAFSILNGIRGIVAPIFGYWLLSKTSPAFVGYVSGVIIAIGCLSLLILRHSAYRN